MAFPWPRPGGPSLLALLLAHAAAVVAVSHGHYFAPPPTRQLWFVLELALALVLWLPARWYLGRVTRVLLAAKPCRVAVALPLALGALAAAWWAGAFEDTLWLHPRGARDVLEPLLGVSHAVVLAAAFAGPLAATVALAPSDPAPGEPLRRREVAAVVLGFAAFLAAANAFTAWYVRQERTVYYWDFMTYWAKTGEVADVLRRATPGEAWDDFRVRTRSEDYGPLPALVPAAAVAAFGDTRLVYELAVVNAYLAGLAAAAWLFVRRFAPPGGLRAVAPLAAVLVSTPAWVPLVRGYLDVGGAALAVLALLAYLSRPAGELPWHRVVLLAGLLVGMALFRRWYSFFVVAFFLAAGVDAAVAAVRAVRSGWRTAARRLAQPVLVGVWAAVLLTTFAAPWVARVAGTSYADDYAAYRTPGRLVDRAWRQVEVCGPGYVAAAGAGFLALVAARQTRRAGLVIGGMCPVMLAHFLRVQDLGTHHQYLFLPALVLLPSLALARAPAWLGWPGAVGLTLAGLAAMAVTFTPAGLPYREHLRPAVADVYLPPLTRDDLPELRRLLHAAGETDGDVVVVASSLSLNPTTFLAADRSLGERLFDPRRLLPGCEVDRRDGFPAAVFRAAVLVVADPPQTHLDPAEQQGIVLTAGSVWRGTDVGKAFDRLPGEYRLGGGVTVRLYRRARAIPDADLREYCERLRRAHPDKPSFFTPPPDLRGVDR